MLTELRNGLCVCVCVCVYVCVYVYIYRSMLHRQSSTSSEEELDVINWIASRYHGHKSNRANSDTKESALAHFRRVAKGVLFSTRLRALSRECVSVVSHSLSLFLSLCVCVCVYVCVCVWRLLLLLIKFSDQTRTNKLLTHSHTHTHAHTPNQYYHTHTHTHQHA